MIYNTRPWKTVTPASRTASLCSTCSAVNITTILRDGLPKENMIPLGPLVDILRRDNQCRLCHLLSVLFQRCWRLDSFQNVDISGVDCFLYTLIAGNLVGSHLNPSKRCHRLCIHFSRRPTEITNAVNLARMDLNLNIQLLEGDAHKFGRTKGAHGRRVADTISMKQVRAWIALCEQEHGDTCAKDSMWWRGSELQLPPFVRVLDVNLMTLVQAPADCRYVALSYVWGMAGDSYWTTKANFDSRTKSVGFDPSMLPTTIQDSIHVTRGLGERYLWIDALCIIQDSSDDKNEQIHAMDLIYSGALLTIVAAGGESAQVQLPGFSAGSRHAHQHIEIIEDLHLAIPLPSLREAVAQTVWDTRGWTYQELLLSRRRLFFTKYQVYFECAKDVWCEDLVAESRTAPSTYHPMSQSGSDAGTFLPPRNPLSDSKCITCYAHIVGQYTQRHLTYSSDIIHAITAITNAMAKAYQLGGGNPVQAFQYGMLVRNLNYSLLWQPRLNSALARRVRSDGKVIAWPSWAWAGWTGVVYYTHAWQLKCANITPVTQVNPAESLIVEWYVVDDHRRLVRLEVKRILSIRAADTVTHPRYSVPEGTIDEKQLMPLPPAGTLVFRTQCAFFRVSRLEDMPSHASFPYTIFHIFSDGRQLSVRIGRVILQSSTPPLTILEFIVLSRCSDTPGLYDEDVYGGLYDGCLLHVMAVKRARQDGRMRERVGLGVICEQAWLECGAEVETVLLA